MLQFISGLPVFLLGFESATSETLDQRSTDWASTESIAVSLGVITYKIPTYKFLSAKSMVCLILKRKNLHRDTLKDMMRKTKYNLHISTNKKITNLLTVILLQC